MANKPRIGFIGLGMMGRPMAENLIKEGYPLKVFNRSREKAQSLAKMGAEIADEPWQTAEAGGIVITLLSDDHALDAVVGPHHELAQRLGRDGIHLSMSTILPATARRLAEAQAEQGGHYLAAPVLGRPDLVQARKQSYFIAGADAAKARVRPVLEVLGAKVFDFGPEPAAANTAKLAANFIIASAIETMSEAFVFTQKNGADPGILYDALAGSLFACPAYQTYGRAILEKNYAAAALQALAGAQGCAPDQPHRQRQRHAHAPGTIARGPLPGGHGARQKGFGLDRHRGRNRRGGGTLIA